MYIVFVEKSKKKFLFLTLAATVFASCSKDKTEEPVNNDIPASYY